MWLSQLQGTEMSCIFSFIGFLVKVKYAHVVCWEPEGHYCSSKMFCWEPEGHYRHRLCTAIVPFWFSTEHHWTAITPFWLSTDDIKTGQISPITMLKICMQPCALETNLLKVPQSSLCFMHLIFTKGFCSMIDLVWNFGCHPYSLWFIYSFQIWYNFEYIILLQNEYPKIFIFKRKKLYLSSNWQHNFFYFHYKSVKLHVLYLDKIKYEQLAVLSDLKNCQFAPRIAIFNLCICCQFEDTQITLPKMILMSHHSI